MPRREDLHDEQEREAKASLDRLSAESETLGSSAFARMAERAKGHFSAEEIDSDDKIELWSTRIGRVLGLLFAIGLVIYLFRTYFL